VKNVVLLGFMGTGKSIVGRRLAVELQYRFVDTDHLIEERTGRKIPEIFSEDGEAHFRSLESEVVAEVSGWSAHVISTGGGVVLNPLNLDRLEQQGILVGLTARPEVILRRVQRRTGQRPLLKTPDPLGKITALLSEREAAYNRAKIKVDTSDIPIKKSVQRILKQVEALVGRPV